VLKGYALLDASASIARRVRESLGNETRGSRAICYPQQVRSRGYATSWPNRSSDSSVVVPALEKTASIRRNEESDAHYCRPVQHEMHDYIRNTIIFCSVISRIVHGMPPMP
jgi:hypothetical protein